MNSNEQLIKKFYTSFLCLFNYEVQISVVKKFRLCPK